MGREFSEYDNTVNRPLSLSRGCAIAFGIDIPAQARFNCRQVMLTVTSAQELVGPGETALCLFTDGRYFVDDGSRGSSGFWFLDPKKPFDTVIIFRWKRQGGVRHVELFTALPDAIEGPETEGDLRGRYNVRLRELKLTGNTVVSWEHFVGSDDHPVAYVSGENRSQREQAND